MFRRTPPRAIRRRLALLLAAMIGLATQASAVAQQQQLDPATQQAILDALTVKNLIGDAVSLSNQQFPEVENAIARFKNLDLAGARDYLEAARKKSPKLPPTDLTLAKMFVIFRDYQRARAFLEKTVTENPGDPEAYLLLADLAFAEGRTTEAHALFEKADALTQQFTENEKRKQNFRIRVLAGRAAVHERRMQWPQAQDLLAQWVAIYPDNPESAVAHQRLGSALFHLGKPTEALEEFRKARELKPETAHPYVWMGQLYTQAGKLVEARKSYEQAYAAEPEDEETAQSYAQWLIQQNDLDKAQQIAAALRQKSPESPTAILLDGVVAKMRNDVKAAEEALMKVLVLKPDNSVAINLLALILAESSNPSQLERALGYAQMNADRFPGNSQANITLAWVLYRMGRLQEGNATLQKVMQSNPNINADSAYLVAQILAQQNQKDKAAQILDQVLKQAAGGTFLYRRDAEALLKQLIAGGVVLPQQSGLPQATPATNPTAPPAVTPGSP
jgi:tetratricopeptide (TPR) repeat protein